MLTLTYLFLFDLHSKSNTATAALLQGACHQLTFMQWHCKWDDEGGVDNEREGVEEERCREGGRRGGQKEGRRLEQEGGRRVEQEGGRRVEQEGGRRVE